MKEEARQIKIFGLQRSGWHYLRWILENNFGTKPVYKEGWRHGMPHEKYRDLTYIEMDTTIEEKVKQHCFFPLLIVKQYNNWLQSIERDSANFYQKRVSPETFYYEYLAAWRGKAHFIFYEDFIRDFKYACDKLGLVIGRLPLAYNEPDIIESSPDWKPEHRNRYL